MAKKSAAFLLGGKSAERKLILLKAAVLFVRALRQ